MRGLKDKIILITGAGSGIGAIAAKRLAEEGAKVLIIGRTEKTLKESAAQHENISYEVADINQTADIKKILNVVKEKFGRLDALINMPVLHLLRRWEKFQWLKSIKLLQRMLKRLSNFRRNFYQC